MVIACLIHINKSQFLAYFSELINILNIAKGQYFKILFMEAELS